MSRIPSIDDVRIAAAQVYTPEGIEIWLDSSNQMLDGHTPAYLVLTGEGDRVLDLIDMLATGAYS